MKFSWRWKGKHESLAEPIPDHRPLTDHERQLVRWMLEHGSPGSGQFLEQLERAQVVSRCPCGCASIDFEIDECLPPSTGMRILGDFEFGDETNLCGAFVFEKGGVLAGLEVYGLAVNAPSVLPNPTELR